jgi:putative ABC transport system substrate-binding protein
MGRALRLQVQPQPVHSATEFDSAFSAIAHERAGAVLVLSTPLFIGGAKRLAELALTHKLPTMFGPREHVEAGGLLSYSPDRADLYRRAATYVDKILKGANPADLPVQQATTFQLIVNLKTAKALGLTIPPSLLQRADEVIQ